MHIIVIVDVITRASHVGVIVRSMMIQHSFSTCIALGCAWPAKLTVLPVVGVAAPHEVQ